MDALDWTLLGAQVACLGLWLLSRYMVRRGNQQAQQADRFRSGEAYGAWRQDDGKGVE